MKLFIVESPGKIKTIQNILPRDFLVKASVGHCYTIERSDNAIDIENNYKPKYVVIDGKQKVVDEIKKLSEQADEVYIATDGDREGESIGMHLAERAVKDMKKIKRVIFHEITKTAILKAIENPTVLNKDLYNAQQARSVLDMLVGFKISPVLWAKVKSGTSAGRVQSIGLRLIVERQREIDKFVPREYWTIPALFQTSKRDILKALYHSESEIPNGSIATQIVKDVEALTDWYVASISKTTKSKTPYPVFNTSSLQQFCSSSFGWDGKVTMSYAQKLYENGLITYHRTDSLNISEEASKTVKEHIIKEYGKEYSEQRTFKTKNKVAQEAHEGIRPTHLEKTLDEVKASVSDQEFKLYEAIYCRFLACQMSDSKLNASKVTITSKSAPKHLFTTNGQIIKFDGYLKAWGRFSNTKDEDLPLIEENDVLDLKEVKSEQHFTKPTAAYNTASLVKVLEEEGIGRPSTYAGIIETLIKRSYAEKDGKSFKPTELGCKICDFLVSNFPELMNLKFTARIEEQLDEIANGETVWYKAVDEFFKEIRKRIIAAQGTESLKKPAETTDIDCPTCKKYKLVKRKGKYGEFYGCAGFSVKGKYKCEAMFKIGDNGEPVSKVNKEVKYLEGCVCDKCGSKIAIRVSTRTGKEFGGCSAWPKCKNLYGLDGTKIEFKERK